MDHVEHLLLPKIPLVSKVVHPPPSLASLFKKCNAVCDRLNKGLLVPRIVFLFLFLKIYTSPLISKCNQEAIVMRKCGWKLLTPSSQSSCTLKKEKPGNQKAAQYNCSLQGERKQPEQGPTAHSVYFLFLPPSSALPRSLGK